MLLVILVSTILVFQRIAFFGKNVHISYILEMAGDSRLLLFLQTFVSPKFASSGHLVGKR
jgi:hypothetical protein